MDKPNGSNSLGQHCLDLHIAVALKALMMTHGYIKSGLQGGLIKTRHGVPYPVSIKMGHGIPTEKR